MKKIYIAILIMTQFFYVSAYATSFVTERIVVKFVQGLKKLGYKESQAIDIVARISARKGFLKNSLNDHKFRKQIISERNQLLFHYVASHHRYWLNSFKKRCYEANKRVCSNKEDLLYEIAEKTSVFLKSPADKENLITQMVKFLDDPKLKSAMDIHRRDKSCYLHWLKAKKISAGRFNKLPETTKKNLWREYSSRDEQLWHKILSSTEMKGVEDFYRITKLICVELCY